MSGKFIVFEGVDNSGKTTVATKIQEWLKTGNIESILTKHPGSTPIGQELRKILKHSEHPIDPSSQALMFAADNSLFINQLLKPSLDKGYWVLGDRNNFISSIAYQIASGCSFEQLDKVHAATLTKSFAKIDVLFVFTCSWEETQKRKQQDELRDRYEDQGRQYFDKLSKCYSTLADQNNRLSKFVSNCDNIHYVDASQPLDDVVAKIKKVLRIHIG